MNLLPLIVCLVLGPGAPSPEAGVTVTVRDNPEVIGTSFTIGEIAEVAGDDKQLVQRIGGLQGGASPLPGLTRRIDAGSIELRLRYYGVDMQKVHVVCAPGTRISRATATVATGAVEQAAIEALRAARTDLAADAEIVALPSRTNLSVMPGKITVVAGAPRGTGESAAASVPVTILVDGKQSKIVEVLVRVKHTVPAVVASRAIPSQTVLTADDVTVARIEVAAGAPAPIQDVALVIGKKAARHIPAGRVLTDDALVTPPVIVAGQAVNVEGVSGGVRVILMGTARSSAAPGQPVRVYCTQTQKEVTGIAIDAKTVRMEVLP